MTYRHAKHWPDGFGPQSACVKGTHFSNLLVGELARPLSFSSAPTVPSVNESMSNVFLVRDPLQIFWPIVGSIKVFVIDFITTWFWPNKCTGNQLVNSDENRLFTCASQSYTPVAFALRSIQYFLVGNISDTPQVGDFILKSISGSPDFGVIILNSHGVDLLCRLTRWLGSRGANNISASEVSIT